jgi:hypothetical protein
MNRLLLAAIVLGSTATPATARIVTIRMTGSVYYLTQSMASDFSLGQSATALLRYDTDSPALPWSSDIAYYPNAPTGGFFRVGDYTVTFNSSLRMFVTNQEQSQSGPIDRVIFDNFYPQATPVAGRSVDVASINFQDWTATALNNLALPTSANDYLGFQSVTGSIDWTPYINADNRVSVMFDTISVSAAPEPATWALMIGGFGMVGGAMRRRRVSAKVTFA